MGREFADTHDVSFWPEPLDTPEFRTFMKQTGQAPDTGIRVAEILWREHIPWLRLERTNRANLEEGV